MHPGQELPERFCATDFIDSSAMLTEIKIGISSNVSNVQAGPGLSETGGKCSPRQKYWPMRENKNTFVWEPMAALEDGLVFGTRKGIFKTFIFWAHFGTEATTD